MKCEKIRFWQMANKGLLINNFIITYSMVYLAIYIIVRVFVYKFMRRQLTLVASMSVFFYFEGISWAPP